jgi:flagellar assembly protein FliH
MTSSSKPATPYGRFIPREELQGFAAWTPGAFGGAAPAARASEPAPPPNADEIKKVVHAARQAGYQDGYRDGLVALDNFKQGFAQQMSAQIGVLVKSFDAELGAMEREMAQAIARTATELARHVVRSELATRPELVTRVAEDAVNAVLHSARHIRISVHPDDQPLVALGAAEALEARGARLMTNPEVARGGCVVDSDVGSIDARIATRWSQAAAALGQSIPYAEDEA